MNAKYLQQSSFESEGEAAARTGGRREDCPYPDKASEAWNFWVYGNENEQGRMIREWRQQNEEGYQILYMSTAPLTPHTEKLLADECEKSRAALTAMRAELGWE
jgi:sarcosine oxidase delta subunit